MGEILSLPAMSDKPERIFSNCYTFEMTLASICVLPQPLQLVISFIFTRMITKITDERELSMSSFNRVSNLRVCDPTPTVVSPSLRDGIHGRGLLRHTDGGDGGGGPAALDAFPSAEGDALEKQNSGRKHFDKVEILGRMTVTEKSMTIRLCGPQQITLPFRTARPMQKGQERRLTFPSPLGRLSRRLRTTRRLLQFLFRRRPTLYCKLGCFQL
jgi:hypothetical protein